MDDKCGIYIITNEINKKFYIGMSKNIPIRWKRHTNEYKNPNSHEKDKVLYRAFRKYGIENFSFKILEHCTEEALPEREIYWIKKLKAIENGYNEHNNWQPQIAMEGEDHPNHKLSEKDVIDIRTRYNNHERCKEVEALYKEKVGHSGFSKVWKGETWKHIMPEVYTSENKYFHLHNTGNKGSSNGRAKLNEDQVRKIRLAKANGEKWKDVYEDYKHLLTIRSFQFLWGGGNWKDIKVVK